MRDCIGNVLAECLLGGITLVVVVVQDECEWMIDGRGKLI